jgi:hypothetical protein
MSASTATRLIPTTRSTVRAEMTREDLHPEVREAIEQALAS